VRVLAIASAGELGGAELALATFVAHRPADVEVAALIAGAGGLRPELERLGVEAREVPALRGRPTAASGLAFSRLLGQELRLLRPDVVWATGLRAATLAVGACRVRRVPLVWHKVDFTRDAQLARPLAAACRGVVAVSEAAAEALGPLRERRLLGVVGPPIRLDPDFIAAPDSTRPTIGTLGRLVPYKGHDRIIAAAGLLAADVANLHVVLAGAAAHEYPGYRAELERSIIAAGLEGRVELPGFVEPREVLERLTVYVNATYRDLAGHGLEGLSGAMLEASWSGVPVVASRGGGTSEGVRDGETGTLVEAADPPLLAAAIRPYLLDPALAARTGGAGRAFAHHLFAPGPAAARLFGLLARAT